MTPAPRFWNARWIHPSPDPRLCYGAFVFRRWLALTEEPQTSLVKVTADQRFRLYVNGRLAAWGPARSDLNHWPYDEMDLAPYLRKGENLVHAVVWSFGSQAPMAQASARTGFILEGAGLDTGESWEGAPVPGYDFGWLFDHLQPSYHVVGPGEKIDGRLWPGWEKAGAASLKWRQVQSLYLGRADGSSFEGPVAGGAGKEEGSGVGESSWLLTPRAIPPMLYQKRSRPPMIVNPETDERRAWEPLVLRPGEEALLDLGELAAAFPVVTAGGSGRLVLRYAEALFLHDGTKGHRGEVKGKALKGPEDWLELGPHPAPYEPLWWRTYRYVLLKAEGEARIDSFDSMETGYPLADESSWESGGRRHREIFAASLRTARRCAGETYFDCPFYEQLQYVADTRIQAQIGRFLSPDRRLQKQAVDAFARSVQPDGTIMSRFPTREPQVIAGFCLWWIHMLHDQHWFDPDGVNPDHLGIAQGILDWFDQTLAEAPERAYWAYADWVPSWQAGVPPKGIRSSIQTIHLLYTKIVFARLTDDDSLLDECRERLKDFAENGQGVVSDRVWDPEGTPGEQSAALLRLCRSELGLPMAPWPEAFAPGTAKASYFYQWYVHQARPKDDYEALLEPWREMLDLGCSTFLEIPDPSRSDCHAWSAHPILGFYQRIAGIGSAAPGWREAAVSPNPGSLSRFKAVVPHPSGPLTVELKDGEVTVDSPVPFRLTWRGKTTEGGP